MRLEAVWFHGSEGDRCERMANVLRYSAEMNSPTTPLTIHRIDEEDGDIRAIGRIRDDKLTYVDNCRKARHQARIINEAKDGEVLGMLDLDTMVLRDLSDLEERPFDLAYTVRPPKNEWKLNSGVYFVRVSGHVRTFARQWAEATMEMLRNADTHRLWSTAKKYGGTHQAALGMLLETRNCAPLATIQLPCVEWNCVSHTWKDATDATRIVHIMGAMREWAFGRDRATTATEQVLANIWMEFDKRSTKASA